MKTIFHFFATLVVYIGLDLLFLGVVAGAVVCWVGFRLGKLLDTF